MFPVDQKALFQKFVTFITAIHQVTHEMTKEIKPDTITPVQYSILEYIAVSQPVTISEISDCMLMSMPNTSRELKKLIEKNLCEKVAAAKDKRKHYIRLSKEGEVMMNEAFKHMESRFLLRLKDSTEEELEEIYHALDILHKKVFYSDKS